MNRVDFINYIVEKSSFSTDKIKEIFDNSNPDPDKTMNIFKGIIKAKPKLPKRCLSFKECLNRCIEPLKENDIHIYYGYFEELNDESILEITIILILLHKSGEWVKTYYSLPKNNIEKGSNTLQEWLEMSYLSFLSGLFMIIDENDWEQYMHPINNNKTVSN